MSCPIQDRPKVCAWALEPGVWYRSGSSLDLHQGTLRMRILREGPRAWWLVVNGVRVERFATRKAALTAGEQRLEVTP